jgi:hypothetical protein
MSKSRDYIAGVRRCGIKCWCGASRRHPHKPSTMKSTPSRGPQPRPPMAHITSCRQLQRATELWPQMPQEQSCPSIMHPRAEDWAAQSKSDVINDRRGWRKGTPCFVKPPLLLTPTLPVSFYTGCIDYSHSSPPPPSCDK